MVGYLVCNESIGRDNVLSRYLKYCLGCSIVVESFSGRLFRGRYHNVMKNNKLKNNLSNIMELQKKYVPRMYETGDWSNRAFTDNITRNVSSYEEGQVLLACRSYLRRKHILEWEGKRQRKEAASSPLFNEGYFWYDPKELLYLREISDPCGIANETLISAISDGDDLSDNVSIPEVVKSQTSTNPFSTNPLYPPDEHVRRSKSREHLWSNQTWRELWFNKRWTGRITSESNKNLKRKEKLMKKIPSNILESSYLGSLSEEEVSDAVRTYICANERKSEARKAMTKRLQSEAEEFRKWRREVKQKTETFTVYNDSTNVPLRKMMHLLAPTLKHEALTFEPPLNEMKKLRAIRAEKAKQAFRKRLENEKSNITTDYNIVKFRQNFNFGKSFDDIDDFNGNNLIKRESSPMQAMLRIDSALDNKSTPSPDDVETIMKPGRLGRRRDILRRILSECFDLRGKCIPKFTDSTFVRMSGSTSKAENDVEQMLFATTCSIHELGCFVLTKLRDKAKSS